MESKHFKQDLWDELNATDESFVRRKYATGGYDQKKRRLVAEWIAHRDAEHRQAAVAQYQRTSSRSALSTTITAVATCVSVMIQLLK